MPTIDLGDYGFHGRVFEYHGQIVSERKEGDRLLFLFDEAHTDKAAIRLSLLNALRLWELGVLACVGVEEFPYYFAGWTQTVIEQRSAQLFQDHGNDEGVIQRRMEGDGQHLKFGKTLKFLRPQINVRSVEDFELHARIKWIDHRSRGLIDNMPPEAPPEARQAAADLIRREFDQCTTNLERDAAFLKTLLPWWQQIDPSKAAILNAGTSHQERIAQKLDENIRYIRVSTKAAP
jgi:hypothetical protein